jgi:hypothetical protein
MRPRLIVHYQPLMAQTTIKPQTSALHERILL